MDHFSHPHNSTPVLRTFIVRQRLSGKYFVTKICESEMQKIKKGLLVSTYIGKETKWNERQVEYTNLVYFLDQNIERQVLSKIANVCLRQ